MERIQRKRPIKMYKLVVADGRNVDGEAIVKEKAIYSDESIPRCSKCLNKINYGSWAFYCTFDKSIFCDSMKCKRRMCNNYFDHTDFYGELKRITEVRK
jgi:hypothetical protein